MIFKNLIVLLFFSILSSLYAQNKEYISQLQHYYQSFEYRLLIEATDSLISSQEDISKDKLIQIYTLKAASHYNIGDLINSRKTFIEILKTKNDFSLDNQLFSPKMLEYFGNIKEEFNEIVSIDPGGVKHKEVNRSFEADHRMVSRQAIVKSLLLPGLGHFEVKKNTLGWILSIASSATLGSMFYFIADAHQKEEDYLMQKDPLLLQSAYDKYNGSYKIRNSLIVAYAAIWLYSQIDLLFFSVENNSFNFTASHDPNSLNISNDYIEFSLSFQF